MTDVPRGTLTTDLFAQAEVRRDLGLERVAARAERLCPEWNERADRLLGHFIGYQVAPFLAEDFVRWARDRILPPPDPRAWGGPIRRAAKAGLIRRIGYAPAASSNLSPKCLWDPVRSAP